MKKDNDKANAEGTTRWVKGGFKRYSDVRSAEKAGRFLECRSMIVTMYGLQVKGCVCCGVRQEDDSEIRHIEGQEKPGER